MKPLKIVALAISALLALSSCAPAEAPSGKFQIVASTNVWADIAKQVGGDLVEVTSIIDNANKDPHSYEASARDQLAVEKADLVIANGGGYDDFIETLTQAAGNKQMFRVNSSVTAVSWQDNEHLWYSIAAVAEVANALAETLGAVDPNNSAKYLENSGIFIDELSELATRYGQIREMTDGYTYFATEPIADWLMSDLGFVNKTPKAFIDAIENETDVAPSVMKEALDMIQANEVKYLVINGQTENAQTQQIVAAASAAGVRAVVLGELLPDNTSYLEWMTANLKTINPAN